MVRYDISKNTGGVIGWDTFKSLCIRNFKYITNNKPLKFDFMNSNIVILDGQNGYGKTTLFDAIEVLVTGKIKHFNPGLQNRKTETLGTLANDANKDISYFSSFSF
ncbi:MAG: AAA family ATPase [Blautia wexlerae]